MIRKVLPILLTSLVGFSTNNFNYTPNYSYRYDFIDYESPAFRLGDYHIFDLESVNAGGGQVRFTRIRASLPRLVFDTLAEYQNVFITIPNYDYNSSVDLVMTITNSHPPYNPVFTGFYLGEIPLSATMLKTFPYTMVDLAYDINVFDRELWDGSVLGDYFFIGFTIPYTEHTNLPSSWQDDLRNITLFTKRSASASYFDGYETGYNDGYTDGNADGYTDGYADGSADSYLDGYNEGYKWGDIDGYNRGINEDFNAYSYLFGMFGAFSGLFAVELLPGLTIGGIAILVLSLTLLPFLIGLFTKGGKR